MRYAARTAVPQDRSRQEIERTLIRYGADQFIYGWEGRAAFIRFKMKDRFIMLRLVMPDNKEVSATPTGRKRRGTAVEKELEVAKRQRWRALALVIKAKLEAVESGIASFENEFLAYTMLPSGETTGDWMAPQLQAAYERGVKPKALPLPSECR